MTTKATSVICMTDNLPSFRFDTYSYKDALEELNIFEKVLRE